MIFGAEISQQRTVSVPNSTSLLAKLKGSVRARNSVGTSLFFYFVNSCEAFWFFYQISSSVLELVAAAADEQSKVLCATGAVVFVDTLTRNCL